MTEPETVEAVYLEGGSIADVGSLEDLSARYPRAKRTSFEQITPGLHDAHTHPLWWGEALETLDLSGLGDPRAVAEIVARKAQEIAPGNWIRGAGYLFESYPTRELLDAAAPNHPVFLQSRDLHSGWVNSRALEQARLTRDVSSPADGAFVRDANGELTGYLLEAAQDPIQALVPKPGLAELRAGLQDLARRGLTATHHMGWCDLGLAEQLARENRIPLRLWWALDKDSWRGVQPGWRGDCLDVAAVKFFADGALGSRTAWMLEPYPDGSFGMPLDALEFIRSEGEEALKAGLGVAVHAIGTAAVRGVLEVFSELAGFVPHPPAPSAPWERGRQIFLRMEHVQHVRDEELPKFGGLPIALSVQPMHAPLDAALVAHHLPGKSHEAFRLRDLWDTGLPLAFGSDAPVAKPHVLNNVRASTRNPVQEGQSLSLQETLWAHTRGAALAAGWNNHGLIQPEAPADLTLWETGKPVGRVFRGELELP